MTGEADAAGGDRATRAQTSTANEPLTAEGLTRARLRIGGRDRAVLAVGDSALALVARRLVCEGLRPLPDGTSAPLPAPVRGFSHVVVRYGLGRGEWRLEA